MGRREQMKMINLKDQKMELEIRSKENVRNNGEVFTPTYIVDDMLKLIPVKTWKDPEYVFLEPTCGNGQFLVRIFQKRIDSNIPVLDALNTIIGMDISEENIIDSRKRLYELASQIKRINKVKAKAIILNNIFQVDDSLKVLKEYGEEKGILFNKKFVYSDPTGNGQVMEIAERRELEG